MVPMRGGRVERSKRKRRVVKKGRSHSIRGVMKENMRGLGKDNVDHTARIPTIERMQVFGDPVVRSLYLLSS